ncbi:diguanylate cyclase domain-containing protein [Neptunomonas antarctica]|uniref:diguanylate cyclase n=1 Tax=Neptunomonas antarctica TaxID=619304 RepID=A0A1N7NDL1_9GAMM|nr:diguanylate cyclase [Neptunomonas antarctica]SIS96382.1 diguanylate cyclase (GGDEF) domain-containing protein/hemerythrin-like metal-binding domain protein [Neptunomonas antarctica]
MIELHAPTAFLVTVAVNVALAISLAAAGSRANRDGLFLSAIAIVLHSLAFGLFGLQGKINDTALIIVAATILSASWSMFAEGLFQFQQRQARHGLIWLPVILILTVFFLFRDNISVRIISSSVIYCAQVILILVVLNQGRRSTVGRGQYFIAIGLAPVIPVFAFRGFLAATEQADKVLILASNQIQAMIFLISIVSTMFVAIGMLIMSKELSEDRNRLLAAQDQLTGLANRRSIDQTLSDEWARASRHGNPLALVMLDVDFFKKYNDQYGHLAGDECLKDVACALQQGAQRAGEMTARYGGEEFLLILPNTDADTAQRLAERMCAAIAALEILHEQSPMCVVTVSAGVATLTDDTYKDVDSLLRGADKALYQAKQKGRNQAQMAPELHLQSRLDKNALSSFVRLSWHPTYESGYSVIDEQHRALFTQINNLLSAVLDGNSAEDVGTRLDALTTDIAQHFRDVEAIITRAGLPDSTEHAAIHNQLVERAIEMVSRFHDGTLGIGELFQFLAHDVLARHMLAADRKYIPFQPTPK